MLVITLFKPKFFKTNNTTILLQSINSPLLFWLFILNDDSLVQ